MKREYITPSKHSRVCAEHLTEDSFEQNLAVGSLLGPSDKPRRLVLKKDAVPTICNFSMHFERCKPAIGQKTREKTTNNARRTASELLGHFPSEIMCVFRSKTCPSNDLLTQKQSEAVI